MYFFRYENRPYICVFACVFLHLSIMSSPKSRVGDFFDFLKKSKKIGFIWFKSDFFYLNWFFDFFLSSHPTPLEVNQSSSAQCLRVDNSNNAIKVKQIYIQIKEINMIKPWINCVEIRGKSSTLKWWNPDKVLMTYKGHLKCLKIIKNFKTGYKDDYLTKTALICS